MRFQVFSGERSSKGMTSKRFGSKYMTDLSVVVAWEALGCSQLRGCLTLRAAAA